MWSVQKYKSRESHPLGTSKAALWADLWPTEGREQRRKSWGVPGNLCHTNCLLTQGQRQFWTQTAQAQAHTLPHRESGDQRQLLIPHQRNQHPVLEQQSEMQFNDKRNREHSWLKHVFQSSGILAHHPPRALSWANTVFAQHETSVLHRSRLKGQRLVPSLREFQWEAKDTMIQFCPCRT